MVNNSTFVMDFEADMLEFFKIELKKIGFQDSDLHFNSDELRNNDELRYRFFYYFKRLISPNPRKVHISRDLVVPSGYKSKFQSIKTLIENGQDLKPYLSTSLDRIKFNDLLLNVYGFHHLHLSTVLRQDGFAERSDDVLFAKFDFDDVYFVNVYPHPHGQQDWLKLDYIRTCYRNWPYLFQTINGSFSEEYTDAETERFLVAKLLVPITIDDHTKIFPVAGVTCGGWNIEIITLMDHFYTNIKLFEDKLSKRPDIVIKRANKKSNSFQTFYRFKFEYFSSGCRFRINHWA